MSSFQKNEGVGARAARPRRDGTTSRRKSPHREPKQVDGKYLIACPECNTQYKIPPASMERKVSCNNCKQSFVPSQANKPRPRQRNQAAPYLAIGGVVAIAVIIGVVIANLGRVEVEMAPVEAAKKSVNIGWTNGRVQAVVAWANAVHDETDFELEGSSDLAAMQKLLGVQPDQPVLLAGPDAVGEVTAAILDALKTDEKSMVFREFKAEEGRLETMAMASSERGTVELGMPPREGSVYAVSQAEKSKEGFGYHKSVEAQVQVFFRTDGPRVLITGWKADLPPRPKPKGPTHKPHEVIAKPTESVQNFGGEQITVREAEPVPLEHLDDTSPELRAEIDQLIADLMDLSKPGAVFARATRRLQQIGKPAIPRLLTVMVETKPGGDNTFALGRVVAALGDITGKRFGYNRAERKELAVGGTDEERMSALKQWYAWWYDNHDRDFTRAIDKEDDETLFLTDEERAALEQAKKAKEQENKNGQ